MRQAHSTAKDSAAAQPNPAMKPWRKPASIGASSGQETAPFTKNGSPALSQRPSSGTAAQRSNDSSAITHPWTGRTRSTSSSSLRLIETTSSV